MKDLLVVMNARDIDPCMRSIRELPIDKAFLRGFTERQIADVAFPTILGTDYDWIWCVSDDVIARTEHLTALRRIAEAGHPAVTGYSQRSHTEFVVNLTDKPLHQDYPAAESYSFRHFKDVVSWPSPEIPTWFGGMSMTGMSMEMWRRFRFDCYGDPGYASDFDLSWRLQNAGIPIIGCRDAFLYHWRHNWVNTSDPRDESPTLGLQQIVMEVNEICGILSWYDESPGWLAAACSGFARVCDQIVAVDGSYALLPGARPASHPLQAEAVLSACEAGGAACTIHRPNDLFYGNEVEKRNLTLRLAGANLTEDDWVLIFDADVHLFKLNVERVRGEFERTDRMIASYTVLDSQDYLSDADLAEYAAKEEYATEWTVRTNDIYRWHPSLMYGPQHWMVSRDIYGERRWLRHSAEDVPPVLSLDAALVAYHRTANRSKIRADAQAAYYQARDLHGVEAAVPGDPIDNGLPELEVA